MATIQVSNSRINSFRRCQRAHYYKYVLGLRPKKKGSALIRGSLIHECLEAYNSGKSWKKVWKEGKKEWDKTYFEEEKIEMGDIPELARTLMENYIEYYSDEELEYLENEKEFLLPLTTKINIIGYIDAVIQEDNKIWVGETKTHAQFPSYDVRVFNMQSALYVWALKELGYKDIKGVLWNYIKAKTPTKPQLLKSGKLSTKKIDSTPLVVEQTLRELGLDLKAYQGLINAQSYSNFFLRVKVPVSKDIVKSIKADTVETAELIYNYPELKARNLSKDCSWCNYKILCQADILNHDTEFLINTEFEEDKKDVKWSKKKENKKRKK